MRIAPVQCQPFISVITWLEQACVVSALFLPALGEDASPFKRPLGTSAAHSKYECSDLKGLERREVFHCQCAFYWARCKVADNCFDHAF